MLPDAPLHKKKGVTIMEASSISGDILVLCSMTSRGQDYRCTTFGGQLRLSDLQTASILGGTLVRCTMKFWWNLNTPHAVQPQALVDEFSIPIDSGSC